MPDRVPGPQPFRRAELEPLIALADRAAGDDPAMVSGAYRAFIVRKQFMTEDAAGRR